MDDDAILAAATKPDGSRRFYPPLEHPATARLRGHLRDMEALPESRWVRLEIDWCKEQLAVFEAGEDHAKREYLRAHRGR